MTTTLKYHLTAFIMLLHAVQCLAQPDTNLIRNWSFEDLQPTNNGDTICPNSGGHIYLSKHWKSADGSVDYFNSCSNEDWPKFGVPNNLYGYQEAYGGVAYGHFGCYTPLWSNAREFLLQELEFPLKNGQGYSLTFRINLADSVNFAVSSVGALFTADDTRYWEDPEFLIAQPQVESPAEVILDDKVGWMEVGGQFVAEGGELFLTIGVFRHDEAIQVLRVSDHPNIIYSWEASSYYIDGIELYEDSSIGISENEAISTTLYPNPSNGQVNLRYEKEGAQVLQWEVADMAGRTVHSQPMQGMEGRASLSVRLPAGVYISAVVADGVRMGVEKLVVR